MILAHVSDLHLGYRAYERREGGRNARELDVERAFRRAFAALPDLGVAAVLVAGDVFDGPDPPATAVRAFADAVEQLRAHAGAVPVFVVAGSRDLSSRGGASGLELLRAVDGVEVTVHEPRRIHVPELSLTVWSLPPLRPAGAPLPEPEGSGTHVLLAHARVGAATVVDPRWTYVALGGEHSHRVHAPRIVHSGALERVSDPWVEAAEERGFVTFDVEAGVTAFHPVPGRAVVSLAPIRTGVGGQSLAQRIDEVVGEVPGGIEGKVVRLTLESHDPAERTPEFLERLRALSARALHVSVSVAPPPGPVVAFSERFERRMDDIVERVRTALPDDAVERERVL